MKILIVEDNMILCGMIEKWLQKAGYEVLTAIDEPGARSILKKGGISLVLGDVRLPAGDGISLLEWMVRSGIDIPFVIMTDYACYPDAVRAVKLGAKDYLPKPVYQEQLLELLHHAAEGREKQYIACDNPKTEDEDFDKVVPRLQADAERLAAKIQERYRKEKEQKRKERLANVRHAEPFRSGMKWGLKLGDKIIVPPIYRSIQAPVGNYCAVEANPHQWGVIMLDGKVVIEARYMNVEIKDNGIASLTLIPGKTRTVDLNKC